MNQPPQPHVVVRPTRGTSRFRRNCWIGVTDGALVASDRRNRRYAFKLDGSDRAPYSHRVIFPGDDPPQRHYIDRRGEAVIVLSNGTCWEAEDGRMVAEAAGLVFDGGAAVPPLRSDGIKLEDSTWPEMRYIQMALAAVIVLVALGRIEVIGLFPWVFVAVGLLGYTLAALFSGVYFGVPVGVLKGRRAPSQPGERNERKRRKRRLRHRG